MQVYPEINKSNIPIPTTAGGGDNQQVIIVIVPIQSNPSDKDDCNTKQDKPIYYTTPIPNPNQPNHPNKFTTHYESKKNNTSKSSNTPLILCCIDFSYLFMCCFNMFKCFINLFKFLFTVCSDCFGSIFSFCGNINCECLGSVFNSLTGCCSSECFTSFLDSISCIIREMCCICEVISCICKK